MRRLSRNAALFVLHLPLPPLPQYQTCHLAACNPSQQHPRNCLFSGRTALRVVPALNPQRAFMLAFEAPPTHSNRSRLSRSTRRMSQDFMVGVREMITDAERVILRRSQATRLPWQGQRGRSNTHLMHKSSKDTNCETTCDDDTKDHFFFSETAPSSSASATTAASSVWNPPAASTAARLVLFPVLGLRGVVDEEGVEG